MATGCSETFTLSTRVRRLQCGGRHRLLLSDTAHCLLQSVCRGANWSAAARFLRRELDTPLAPLTRCELLCLEAVRQLDQPMTCSCWTRVSGLLAAPISAAKSVFARLKTALRRDAAMESHTNAGHTAGSSRWTLDAPGNAVDIAGVRRRHCAEWL